jgi:hypothetical protein
VSSPASGGRLSDTTNLSIARSLELGIYFRHVTEILTLNNDHKEVNLLHEALEYKVEILTRDKI